jgi:hypothetical protein
MRAKKRGRVQQGASGLGSGTVGSAGNIDWGKWQYPAAAQAAGVKPPAKGGTPTPPPDPALMQQEAGAANALRIGDAFATFQNTQIDADYGFAKDGTIDPNNPYSRAALLQRSYQDTQRGTGTSYAAAGQYNSGAYQRMQGRNAENFDVGVDQLKKAQGREKSGVLQTQVQNYSANSANLDPAKLESLLKALGF